MKLLGKIEGRRRRGQQDEIVGWHHRLSGRGFEQTPGNGEGQGGLASCSPWGHKEPETTERLNRRCQHRSPIRIRSQWSLSLGRTPVQAEHCCGAELG